MSNGIQANVAPPGSAAPKGGKPAVKPGIKNVKKQGISPVLLFGMLALAGLLAWMAFGDEDKYSLAANMPEPPALFGEHKACKDSGTSAAARAVEAEQAALAKSERQAFDRHDGVDAVALYAYSASCYAAAGDMKSERRLRAATERATRQLNGEYQAHQLKLRLALDRGANTDAYREAVALRTLLKTHSGPFVGWLSKIEHKFRPPKTKRRIR